MSLIRRMFVDIETCPNIGWFWRPGRKISLPVENILEEARIITICWKWEGKKEVHSLDWGARRCDKTMLRQFVRILMQADQVVAHNGDRFDLPWIRTRCLFHRINIPAQLPSVDTLKLSSRGFNFNSRKLDYLGKYMGHGGKKKHDGADMWKATMSGDAKALASMVAYCKEDVTLTEKVHGTLYGYSKPTTHLGVMAGGYKHHCPKCASDNTISNGRTFVTSAGTVNVQMWCKDCGTYWRMSKLVAMKEQLREYEAKKLAEGKR